MVVETHNVTVVTLPEINARVYINSEDTGKDTPTTFELVEGSYRFKVDDLTGKYMFVEWWKNTEFLSKTPEIDVYVDSDFTLEARTTERTVVKETIVPIISYLLAFIIVVAFLTCSKEVLKGVLV